MKKGGWTSHKKMQCYDSHFKIATDVGICYDNRFVTVACDSSGIGQAQDLCSLHLSTDGQSH